MTPAPMLRLMTRVAQLYHEQGLRQAEIAYRLDLSQSRVSRLLKQAEKEGIVRTTVAVPQVFFPELEERIQVMHGLREVIVVDAYEDDDQAVLRTIGAAAAAYVETTVQADELIGISSWSETLLAMVDSMHPQPRPAAQGVVQLLGGMGNPAVEKHATHLTRRLAELVGGEPRFLPAPGVAGSAASRRAMLDDPYVATAMGWMHEVTLALVGIGAPEPSKLLAASGNVVGPEEQHELRQLGAAGDICLRFYDDEGVPVVSSVDERIIGMELEQLKQPRRCVGLAGGPRKLAAIQGALRGRYINVLITDRFTAERIAGDWSGIPATAPAEVDQ